MQKSYFLQNNYNYGDSRSITSDGIIEVSLGYNADTVLSYAHQNQRLEVEFNRHNGMIESLTLLIVNDITLCRGNFSGSTFIELEHTFAMGLDKSVKDTEAAKQHIRIDQVAHTCIYDDAILFDLESEAESIFLFWNSPSLGILTNRKFEITGFVFYNFTAQERTMLSDFIRKPTISKSIAEQPYERKKKGLFMLRNNALITNILKLTHVSFVEFLYYGLLKGIIDESFCVDFACELLSQKKEPEIIWVTIAELTASPAPDSNNRVLQLLGEAIKDKEQIATKQMPLFNKIWFYLIDLVDLQQLNVLNG